MTTRPRAGSSCRLGFGSTGEGAALGSSTATLAEPFARAAESAAATGIVTDGTVRSFDMAALTAPAAPFWRPVRADHAPGAVKTQLSAPHPHDSFHLYRDVARQAAHPDGGARRTSTVAEHLHEQVRAAVDHLGMAGEVRHRVHHAQHLQHRIYTIQCADGGDHVH